MRALYVTHPQVRIDANVPVPLWGLSELGRQRAEAFADRGVVPKGAMIFSSRESKAMELADILAASTGGLVLSDHLMGENDRSATGFLPPGLFEETADQFFAEPRSSVDGWERAIDAQSRIVGTVRTALGSVPEGTPAVFCGHGAVGTLLKCHVLGVAITRAHDQSRHADKGGGNRLDRFGFDIGQRSPERYFQTQSLAGIVRPNKRNIGFAVLQVVIEMCNNKLGHGPSRSPRSLQSMYSEPVQQHEFSVLVAGVVDFV